MCQLLFFTKVMKEIHIFTLHIGPCCFSIPIPATPFSAWQSWSYMCCLLDFMPKESPPQQFQIFSTQWLSTAISTFTSGLAFMLKCLDRLDSILGWLWEWTCKATWMMTVTILKIYSGPASWQYSTAFLQKFKITPWHWGRQDSSPPMIQHLSFSFDDWCIQAMCTH